jgi:hypothetical protein
MSDRNYADYTEGHPVPEQFAFVTVQQADAKATRAFGRGIAFGVVLTVAALMIWGMV